MVPEPNLAMTPKTNEIISKISQIKEMKKRDRKEDNDNYHHYPLTDILPEIHTFEIKLFNVLKTKGIEKKVFLVSMKEAGYEMSEKCRVLGLVTCFI
jgi:hypothetical protein